MATEWIWQPAHAIAAAVKNRETSAEHVARACLDRIAAVDPQIGAFTEPWEAGALAQAQAIDQRIERGEDPGPLAGVPIALKDVLCTVDGTTTCCSKILAGYRSPFDATCVAHVKAQGAVLLGKLNMDEFAMGSSTENSGRHTTRNPWNLQCVPGGSSGGSSAAVAAGMCPIALGTDTGGSIRQPASLCGVIGMKPTYGRVSRWGLVAFASSLDQAGPFCRDSRDLALSLNAICGHDPQDSTSAQIAVPDFERVLAGGVEGLRLGVPREFFGEGLDPEVGAAVEKAMEVYRNAGATLVDIELPHSQYAVAVYYIVATAEASANLARFDGIRYGFRHPDANDMREVYVKSRSEGFGTEVKRRILLGTYVLSSGYYDAYYLKAQKVRALIRQDFERAFEQCEAILTPTAPTPAFRIGARTDDPLAMYLSDVYTISCNLYGGPGVSVPCGLTSSGLPIGMQLMGRLFDEETLVRMVATYERKAGMVLGEPAMAEAEPVA